MTREEIRKKWREGQTVSSNAVQSIYGEAKRVSETDKKRISNTISRDDAKTQPTQNPQPNNNLWNEVKSRANRMLQQASQFSSTANNVVSAMKKDIQNKKEITDYLTEQEKLLIEKRTADYVKKEEMKEKTARQRATAEILQEKGTPVDDRPIDQRLLEKYDSFMGSETKKALAETETVKKVSNFADDFHDVVAMGSLGGLTDTIGGILKYGTAEGAYQANLGEEKDANRIVTDFMASISALHGNYNMSIANDIVNDLKDETDNNRIKEILNDDQTTWYNKILKIVEDSAVKAKDKIPVVKVMNSLIQFAGKINNNVDEAFLKTNEGINKVTDFVDTGIQKELEDSSEAVKFGNQAFRSAVGSVSSGAIGTVTGTGMLPMYASTVGNSSAQKVKENETDADWFAKYEETRASANREGMTEILWEKLSDGLEALGEARKIAGGAEVTKLDDLKNTFIKYVGKKIDNQTTKKLVTKILSNVLGIGEEIVEEIGTDLTNFAFDKASDENATYTLEDLKNTIFTTIASVGLANTTTRLAGGTSEATKVYNDLTYEEAIEKIDNSDLDESRKNALKIACKLVNNNFQDIKADEIDKSISLMQGQQKNAETAEKQDATIKNKPLLKQEQQTALSEGEITENATSQQIEETAEYKPKNEENLADTTKTNEKNDDKVENNNTINEDLDKPVFGNYQVKDMRNLVENLGKDKVIQAFNLAKNNSKAYVSLEELNEIIDNPPRENVELNETQTEEINPKEIQKALPVETVELSKVQKDRIKDVKDFYKRQIEGIKRYAHKHNVPIDYKEIARLEKQQEKEINLIIGQNSNTTLTNTENLQDEGSILLPQNALPTKQNEPKLLKATEVDEDIQAFEEETANLDKEQKERSFLHTTIESDFVSREAQKEAEKMLKTKTYTTISNNESIEKATKTIENTGLDNVYGSFNMKFDNNEKMTLDDLVTAEILIQQYSYRGEIEKAKDLIEKVAIVGTELGQMVQALSIIKKSNPLAQLQIAERIIDRLNKQQREKLGKKAKKIELSEDTIKAIKESTMDNIEENISKAYAEVGQQLTLTWGEKLDNFRYLAMLGNPKTHIRNVSGNIAMHYLNNLKNQVSGGIQDVYQLFKKNHKKTNTLKRANRDQRQFAKEDAKLMRDSIDNQGNKYNDKAKNEIAENKRLFDNKALNALAKGNSWLLDKEDALALQWAYKDAMQDYMSANNLSSEDLRVQESDDEATIREKTNKLNKAREVAINQALEATFHQYSALANTLNELERKGGVAGAVVAGTTPYKRTPINIAKTGVAYSPVGLLKSMSYDVGVMQKNIGNLRLDFQEGKITEQEFNEKTSKVINKEIDQISKGLTGSALTAIGVTMAMNGLLKIKAGNEDDEDEFMESLGQQKYSITIGDYNISLDWLSPSAIPLFMGVEMYNSIKQAEEDEDVSILTALFNGTLNSLNPLFETTMLSNVLSTFASYSSDTSGKMGDVLATIALNFATQFIPSGVTNVYKSLDGLIDGDRSIKTTTSTKKDTFEKAKDKFWNQVKYRLPVTETYELLKAGGEMVGLNLPEAEDTIFAKLPEKVDSYGQVQYRKDTATELVNNLLNPATINDVSDVNSPITKELAELNKAVDTNVLPSTLDKTFSISGESHRMDNAEYANAQKTYGSAYYDAVNALINETSYESIKDNEIKADLISDIKSYAREKAKVEFAESAGIEYKSENEMYNTLTAIEKAGGNAKDYLKYVVDTYNMESDSEKLRYLNSHYTPEVRNAIYENDVGKYTYVSKGQDEKYEALKAMQKGKVSEGYTVYVQKSKENAFKAEKGATGWEAGSKRNKLYDFLTDKSNGLTNMEKYYIATYEGQAKYILNQKERTKLRKYLNSNRAQIGEETYNSMIKKLDEAEK